MKINSIRLKNFVCFLDESFKFSEGLNVISAKNGAGKSQLFNAFYWTLFGEIYDRNQGFIKENEDVLVPDFYRLTDSPEDFKTLVKINLTSYNVIDQTDNDELIYEFEREVRFKRENGVIKVKIPSTLQISYVQHGETEYINASLHDEVIERLIPQKIRKFMWYVGETMKDLIDFENGQALEYALDQISYYPTYKKINKVCLTSESSLNRKIEKELKKANKLSSQQEEIISSLKLKEYLLEGYKLKLKEAKEKKQELLTECGELSDKLKGYDHFIKYKENLLDLESKIDRTKSQIDDLENKNRENLVGTWMINGCAKIIGDSKKNLNLIGKQLEQIQENKNPIPTNLPGSDYVQRMIDDCRCYICERDVELDSPAFHALKRRVDDIKINRQERLLEENCTELNRFKNRLSRVLPKISEEIANAFTEKNKLIKERNSYSKKKSNLYVELNIPEDQQNIVTKGASSAKSLMDSYNLRSTLREKEDRKITSLEGEIFESKAHIKRLNNDKEEFISAHSIDIIEEKAVKYVRIISKATEILREEAYEKMIIEIETKSNELYDIYLSNDPPGKIKITRDVDIVDFVTEEGLDGLSTAQETAGKLSVINSILLLSEIKKNESYPLVMDAPTSDYDPENTISITENISKTFGQIIIMSKDYQQLSEKQRKNLVRDAEISNFYDVKSIQIDQNKDRSRTNRQSKSFKL